MGKIRVYSPVKIIAAITFAPDVSREEIIRRLEKLLSPIDSRSGEYAFDFTRYYEAEMGANLRKQMFSFRELIPAEQLPDIKIATNLIEEEFFEADRRRVNIDPGYICAAKLVLATTKDYDHRIYLGRGIFGDVHLCFRKGHFRTNRWTYPDYQQPEILAFFENVRKIYLEQLRDWPMGEPNNEEFR